jgi:hypothetical protein
VTCSDTYGSLSTQLSALADAVTSLRAATIASSVRPQSVRIPAQAVADSSGNALIVFATVPGGRVHHVRQLVVGGATWGTTASGTAVVFVGTGALNPDYPVPLTQVADSAATLPKVGFYLEDQVVVPGGASLQVLVTGATSGQTYYAAIRVLDLPLGG